ncbi:hypothetical protein SHKM778_23950 [Streptomyces sp. KM77-8]|uniref:DUF3093 domain-containing protein n=1 Tax=Streptomyces haneummycinicus TaxID=3074435 RepID=A0AAT9HF33_9ACTN
MVGVSFALILLPFGTLPMLGGLACGTAAAAVMASAYGSVRIRVVGGHLIAGEAKIPVSALGEPEILDEEEARAWRTHKADPRCFMLLRAYIPGALRVDITDPEDPTPYVFLSTRTPSAWPRPCRRPETPPTPRSPQGRGELRERGPTGVAPGARGTAQMGSGAQPRGTMGVPPARAKSRVGREGAAGAKRPSRHGIGQSYGIR